MTTEQKIIHYMTTMAPADCTLVDGPTTYNSTQHTHQSFARHLITAERTSQVYRIYLLRCYNWLKLLHKNKINLQNINN